MSNKYHNKSLLNSLWSTYTVKLIILVVMHDYYYRSVETAIPYKITIKYNNFIEVDV